MGKQLVVSGNRIIAHGIDCFLSMGGTVICPDTGRTYQNATVVECEYFPGDIDSVGYEYHAGRFVPCAPYGVGNGNVAVVCNEDCKSLKDSGIPFDVVGRVAVTKYTGNGDSGQNHVNGLFFDRVPKVLFISVKGTTSGEYTAPSAFAIITPFGGMAFVKGEYGYTGEPLRAAIYEDTTHARILWYSTNGGAVTQMNESGKEYKVTAIY